MAPDVAIVSLGTTFGWRHADATLAAMIREAGYSCQVVPVRVGRAAKLKRTLAMTDLVEAAAARRAARDVTADRVIFSSITAALLQRPRVPYAVRFDTVATLSRPGPTGAWQRRREPAVLAGAHLLLPWSRVAGGTAERLLNARRTGRRPPVITLPVPIERIPEASARDIDAVAYAANPRKRGLDLLCQAWRLGAPTGARLIVGGIARQRALEFLREAGQQEPSGVQWVGELSRSEWLDRVARARVFVNASRYEDWGIAQLEALSSGTPVVTVPSPGPYEALSLVRELRPELVAPDATAESLAAALAAGLKLGASERSAYAAAADAMLEPYRDGAVRRVLTQEVLPALLRSPS